MPIHQFNYGGRTGSPPPRGSAHKRGYGSKWRRLRLRFLRQYPLCADCLEQEKTTAAQEVHHIRKHHGDQDLALDWDNLLSLCSDCHAKRTARGE